MSWVAPSTTRCTLSVDRAARWSCLAPQPTELPVPAVSTKRGLDPKSTRAAASRVEAPACTYSSMVLRRFSAVEVVARSSSRAAAGISP
jgi:hypothetical protein